jgi:hypothetical protein
LNAFCCCGRAELFVDKLVSLDTDTDIITSEESICIRLAVEISRSEAP